MTDETLRFLLFQLVFILACLAVFSAALVKWRETRRRRELAEKLLNLNAVLEAARRDLERNLQRARLPQEMPQRPLKITALFQQRKDGDGRKKKKKKKK